MKRTRRVGSLTSGAVMIVTGGALLCHTLFGLTNYRDIFRFWPLVIIGLGAEILFSDREDVRYDGAAVVMMFSVLLFSMGMAAMEILMAGM